MLKITAELPQKARELAGNNFRQGYNCAEAIWLAYHTLLDLGVPGDTVRAMSGFGGGMGHAGCVCGALNASVVVLGLLYGRRTSEESRDNIYRLARQFHDLFEQKMGATCCRSLNPHPFDTREHLRHCLKITGNTALLLGEFLLKLQDTGN